MQHMHQGMQPVAEVEQAFLSTHPAKKEVVKKVQGESMLFPCHMSEGLLKESNGILVEVWTNITGKRTGH